MCVHGIYGRGGSAVNERPKGRCLVAHGSILTQKLRQADSCRSSLLLEHVRVDTEREGRIAVAHAISDRAGVKPFTNEQRSMQMPKIVEADVAYTCPLLHPVPGMSEHHRRQGATDLGGEHTIGRSPRLTGRLPLDVLATPMLLKDLKRVISQRDDTCSLPSLGSRHRELAASSPVGSVVSLLHSSVEG